MFVRGDDRNPTGKPLSPGVPESLGGSFEVQPVTLPLAAFSPDRRADVIQAQMDESKKALARAEVVFEQLTRTIEGSREARAGAT